MRKNNKRTKMSFFRRNRIAIIFLSTLLVYLSVTTINQQMKLKDLKDEEKQLLSRVEYLKKELNDIEKKIEESSSLDFIEKTAREKLKMVRQNEIIYIIQDKKE